MPAWADRHPPTTNPEFPYNCGPCQSTCGNGSVECDEVCDADVSCSSAGNFTDVGSASCVSCTTLDTNGCTACSLDETGMCFDGVDNDCDGLTDITDPDCCLATENPEASCSDNMDNDCDGAVDNADPDCQSCGGAGTSCTSNSGCCSNKCRGKSGSQTCKGDFACEASETSCTDLVDNDCDGFADCSDAACSGDPASSGGPCTAADVGESCRNDSDCCSLSCSKGNPSTRVCLL